MRTRWVMIFAAAAGTLLAVLSAQGDGTTVTIRKGDTISYVCVKHYGSFTPEIASAVIAANPNVKDLNAVDVGWKIVLPDLSGGAPAVADTMTRYSRLTGAARQGVVTYLSGPATWRKSGGSWETLAANEILATGDQVRTGSDSRAEVILDSKSVLRVGPETELTLTAVPGSPSEARPDVSVGRLWANVAKVMSGAPRSFAVGMPLAVAGVQGTVYRIDVWGDASGLVRVYDGVVEVSSRSDRAQGAPLLGPPWEVPGPSQVTMEEWVKIVRAMMEMRIGPDGRPTEPAPFTAESPSDEWVAFNKDRDRDLGW